MERRTEEILQAIARPDAVAGEGGRQRMDRLTKPVGSLGHLEGLYARLAAISGNALPSVRPATLLLAAADHGVAAEGVSAYPQAVTGQMVQNFLAGGAAVAVLCRLHNLRLVVVDAGVAGGAPAEDILQLGRGPAGNILREPAMSRAEAEEALLFGIGLAEREARQGGRLLLLGEMGIANTTPSSCLAARLGGFAPEEVTGRGTGLTDEAWQRKVEVVRGALRRSALPPEDPLGVLADLGGGELAVLAGAILGAARHHLPVLLDGFITTAAALVAVRLEPRVSQYLLASHRSEEPGHGRLLGLLGLSPLLELGLRLGEGSGAALAFPLLEAATVLGREMATFEEAAVSGPAGAPAPARSAPDGRSASPSHAFAPSERAAVYKAIYSRRDIRRFRSDPLPPEILERLLLAAHHAPSVGFMQPWNFIVIEDGPTKAALKELVDRERQSAAVHFPGERGQQYLRLKVEGLTEAPVTLCVTSDPTRAGPHVLGRSSDPHTDVYSVSCAIENLWLAARAEGVAVGWVSIFQKADLRQLLGIPPHVDPIALLSLGYTDHFPTEPLLATAGWRQRQSLEPLLFAGRWGTPWRGGL